MSAARIGRRTLLKGSAALGAGLAVGVRLPVRRARGQQAASPATFAPSAFVRIDRDGVVTVVNGMSEMGQGTWTTMAMIVADELEADWSTVRIEQAPTDPAFTNPGLRQQMTAGSFSIRSLMTTWRRAGAAAREMLVAAAAKQWGVPVDECYAENGQVIHRPTGRRLDYGQLVDRAAQLPVPQNPKLKTPDQFKLIGKNVPRRDTPDKVTGRAVYGIDVVVPGMLVATVQRCPVFGGKVASVDASAATAVPGVRHVVQISSGVAVVADGYWAARRGRDALRIRWDEGPNAALTSAAIRAEYRRLAQQPGAVARREGDGAAALARGVRRVEAVYETPFLAHATMEPMNCTAHVRADACEVWAPTQNQAGSQQRAMRITGLPREKVLVHTTLLGGGFGRRGETDYVADAVETSKSVGAPVKVVWSREDDTQHGYYRPYTYNVLHAALDGAGDVVAWSHRLVSTGLLAQRGAPLANGIDRTAVEGAVNMPYAIRHLQVEYHHRDLGVPVGFWRSVGASHNAFVVESFVDELAAAAGKDPFEYRRALLGRSPRHRAVLELAAQKAGWSTPAPAGRHRGIAVAFSYGSYAAEVAEVSVAADGRVRVHRVVCAIDCGVIANPDQVKAQMEGGIVYGLTAALYGEITIDRGRVQQSNFHDYPMLRIDEMPQIEVHILESDAAPGGAGEPGTPPVAPAVTNAVFAATGVRVRSLPVRAAALLRRT